MGSRRRYRRRRVRLRRCPGSAPSRAPWAAAATGRPWRRPKGYRTATADCPARASPRRQGCSPVTRGRRSGCQSWDRGPLAAILAERPRWTPLAAGADERIGEAARDVESGLLRDLDEARRAGDVHLGEVVADHVETDHEHAFCPQPAADAFGDLAIARRNRPRHAAAARGEIAARLTGLRDAREHVWHRFARDHDHALVAV